MYHLKPSQSHPGSTVQAAGPKEEEQQEIYQQRTQQRCPGTRQRCCRNGAAGWWLSILVGGVIGGWLEWLGGMVDGESDLRMFVGWRNSPPTSSS